MRWTLLMLFAGIVAGAHVRAESPVVYEGRDGVGRGKHVVFLAGDEEYRSEEGLPMLAKILSVRHGFKCSVVFPINPTSGLIDPNNQTNLPGVEVVRTADVVVMLWRFRELPDAQMKHFVDYYLAGKPIIALRTSTHAFEYKRNKQSPYAKFGWGSKEWAGGFGKQVLGETWVSHWGVHKKEATRGVIEASAHDHPVLRGVTDIFGDTDVYEAQPPADATILVRGQVLKGMTPTDPPAQYKKKTAHGKEQDVNDPMMPVVWLREYKNEAGTVNKILTTTLGSATDLQSEGLRRLMLNGVLWSLGLENKISAKASVEYVGEFKPTMYGFNSFKKDVPTEAHALK